jgi:hypothetical protein
MKIIGYAAVISYIMSHKKLHQLPRNWLTATLGICSGLFVAGIYSMIQSLIPTDMPLWPQYEALSYTSPLLTQLTSTITHYAQYTIAFSLLFILIDTATQQWQKYRMFFMGFAAFCGMLGLPLSSLDIIGMWIIAGALLGWTLLAMYRYIIRYDYALIPLATGSSTILYIAQQGIFNAYPGALMHACISACTVGIISVTWYWCTSR